MPKHPSGVGSSPVVPSSIPVGFQVIHGNRLEDLRALVVEVIRNYPLGPLDDEVFLVHSNGIAQWLKLALARDVDDNELSGLGIAAGMQFSLPSRFLWQAYRSVLGKDAVATQSPYDKDQLVWRLYRLLPGLAGQPVFEPLQRFMAGAEEDRRHFQLAERIADLFDQYQVYRADWLEAWRQGRDLMRVRGDREQPVPEEQSWQPELWRRLVADIETQFGQGAGHSRADIHNRFLEAADNLLADNRPAGLPRRLIVFGVSSLPQQTLEVLYHLGQCMQVLLCIHNPCRYYWADIVEDRDLLRAVSRRGQRRSGMPEVIDDNNLHLHAHPLLAAWGKQGRDYIRLLDEYDDQTRYRHCFDAIDLYQSPVDGVDVQDRSLLMAVQDDILNLRPVQEAAQPVSGEPSVDSSIVFHDCHSAQRETEVLHDQLLAAFEADPTLRPQDIIVMVPDIDAYAPHIQAAFGQLDPDDDRYIPFTISDQGQRHQIPALIALETLLSLPESRIAVSDVLDLLDVPSVRHRFGLEEEDLPQLHQWIQGANIRWGLDAGHRASQGLPDGMAQNTWVFGLRRMLLGYAVGDGELWQGIEPYGEVGGLESRLAGQLALLLEGLSKLWAELQEPKTPEQWAQLLNLIRQEFFGDLDEADTLVFSQMEQTVEQWIDACHTGGLHNDRLPLTIAREIWLADMDKGGLSQRFLAGKVNFATLMPMRAIPFRHICLLGMNDGDYPRSQSPLDFDLMANDYRPGDRSRREDDRYLFLEALLSARKQLYISWVGRSINDNSERPPSVLVAQLLDHLDGIRPIAVDKADDDLALSKRLVTEHPLQPFSSSYFPGDGGQSSLFTYAREWRQAHDGPAPESSLASSPDDQDGLPPGLLDEPLSLSLLGRFLQAPVDTFFQQRLGVRFSGLEEPLSDDEPFVLDGLERWQLTDELIQQVLADHDLLLTGGGGALEPQLQAVLNRQAVRGDYPQGGIGQVLQQQVSRDLPELFEQYRQLMAQFPSELDLQLFQVSHQVGPYRLVVEDWIGELRAAASGGWARVGLSSSNLTDPQKRYRWNHGLRPWVVHLAACLLGNEPVTTCLLSKTGNMTFPSLPSSDARNHLEAIISAWVSNLEAPLPVAPKTAFAWLTGSAKGEDRAMSDARTAYEGGYNSLGEADQVPALRRAFPDFDALVAGGEFEHWVNTLYRPLWQAVKQEGKA